MHTTLYPVLELEDSENPGATKMMTREELKEHNLTVGSREIYINNYDKVKLL